MFKSRLFLYWFAAQVGGLVLSGLACAKSVEQRVVTYLDSQAHTSLYPPAAGFYPNGMIMAQITDRLTWQDPQTLEIKPWIAERWEISPDKTRYIFYLRSGITFSDGSALDAAAVARNYDTFGKGNKLLHLPPAEVFSNYDHSKVLTPYSVAFYFSAPSPGFLQGTSVLGAGLVSAKTLAHRFEELGTGQNIIGSGPFVVQNDIPGKEITLRKRPDYAWGPPNLGPASAAQLAGIHVIVIPEDSIRIGALLSGQADFIRDITPQDEAEIVRQHYCMYASSTGGVSNSIAFHPENKFVQDERVRRALLLGTNRAEIVSQLFSPSYPLAKSILVAPAKGFQDYSDLMPFDPAKANALLAEAGWQMGSGGWRQKDGQSLTLTMHEAPQHPQSHEMLVLLATQWRKLGVDLRVISGSPGMTILDNLNANRTAMADVEVGRADLDVLSEELMAKHRNVLLQTGGQSRYAKTYTDSFLNTKLEALVSTPDETARQTIARTIQEHILEHALMIPVFEEPQVYVGTPALKNVLFEAVGRPYFYKAYFASQQGGQ
ncbi:TIGR04028 family ABC transporter substrate-binding protein [Acetobacter tropicalis]|uniref:TIGR04028 family ABC transporter substrate-binding protein n=1 Tax=Acetobacter tropicalis TaxID=104102 RepID=UPI0039751BF9